MNLTRFSLFFPEKRDFFLEGAGIFKIGEEKEPGPGPPPEQLFYSRRIGLEEGNEVPIVVGAKISGKLGKYSLGILNVLTDAIVYKDNDQTLELPSINHSVFRIKKDILQRSSVGFAMMRKDPLGGGECHRTIATDANFSLGQHLRISGWFAGTWAPDQVVDNLGGSLRIRWRSDRWGYSASYLDMQDNFDPQMGFILRSGIRKSELDINWSPRPKISFIRQIFTGPRVEYTTDQDKALLTRTLGWGLFTLFQNGAFVFSRYEENYDYLDEDWEIREGIIIPKGGYKFRSGFIFFRSDQSRRIAGGLGTGGGEFYNGSASGIFCRGQIKPTRQLTWDLEYNYNNIRLPEDTFVTHVLSSRITYTFTTELFAKTYTQWNDDDKIISNNLLINYEYKPGSDIYLVYNHIWDITGTSLKTNNWTVLLKVSYLLNL